MPFAAIWMDLEIIILSEVSQKEKDKQYMRSLICGISNMTQTNLLTKEQVSDIENKHHYQREVGGWEEID